MGNLVEVNINVNGMDYRAYVEPYEALRDVLRDKLGFTGVKRGCDYGGCGACTVIMDGRTVYSCLVFAARADGSRVTTIEGLLSADGDLHPLQEAFIEHWGVQCGFCTPGMILSAKALLDENPSPTEQEVREAIAGNICRCTGYVRIIEAILAASKGSG